MQKYTKLL